VYVLPIGKLRAAEAIHVRSAESVVALEAGVVKRVIGEWVGKRADKTAADHLENEVSIRMAGDVSVPMERHERDQAPSAEQVPLR